MTSKERKELKDAVVSMRVDWFEWVEFTQLQAKLTREKYNALIESGFTKQEALEIIKARGAN